MTAKPVLHPGARNPVSDRHRQWGSPILATDIDAILLVEYSRGKIAGLVDYKLGLERPLSDGEGHALATLAELADRAGIPGYAVKYEPDPWRFRVYPMPGYGSGTWPHGRGELVTERQWVEFLYYLRGLPMPAALADRLDNSLA